ncbi:MAG: carbohydrate binding domain-containing protein [Acidimicrobiales bacterium]
MAALVAAGSFVPGVAPSVGATPVPGAPACPMTPADSLWHADVSALPVHTSSAGWVTSVGTTAELKADFGAGMWDGGPIGIPYTTVSGTQARVPVSFDYADESDPGPYPVPANAPIEGGPNSSGDRHVLVVDRDACRLWELYAAYPQNGGTSWTAGSGATWDLRTNTMRPLGWTSGDAAGLPILPGLVRYDEVASGVIDHAIRFTPPDGNAYVWPASHKAATGGASDPPMGQWFRLRADFDISGYSAQNQVILRALQEHGMVLADNGSSWFMSGAPDSRWNDGDLQNLRNVPGSAFEAVDVSSIKASNTSYAVRTSGVTTTLPPPATVPPTTVPPTTITTATRPPSTTTSTTTVPATTTLPPPTTVPPTTVPPAPTNLLTNPGFESSLAGWNTGTNRTILTRICTVAHGAACSVQLGARSSGETVLDDSPNAVNSTVGGTTYTASAWVNVPVGRSVTVRLREYRVSAIVRYRTVVSTGTGTWQQLSVTSAPTDAGGSLSLDVIVSLTTSQKAYVDDLSLRRA